ncbi:efflux RND transporter periplasmic adaptor subunit [Amorphus orientalis]|uniref:Multidrug efflux pump subunit AcrA (Membrane-fusion protein) n=1 Tax=Amorphus orientalis TaxID=649198 RepID=A0AAE3VQ38_9HYPH|nr:HlyD family efflux transporter periplasmic adaptor subunit [Amorphus orientalis]MDQ0316779.1 multidrug efflux pump subunit AcrA (membrane-fusion protein) [Amorphus orientalis]
MDDNQAPKKSRPVTRAISLAARAVLPVLILVGAVALTQWMVSTRPEVTRRPPQETAVPVGTVEVRRAANVPVLKTYGEIVSAARVELRALVGGKVVAVHPNLEVGGLVEKGDVLLTIDDFAYEGALTAARANLAETRAQLAAAEARVALRQSAVTQAETQLELAERDLDRAQRLVERNAVSEQALDERTLIVSQRRQALDQLTNEINVETAGIEQQRAAIDRLEWRVREAERNLDDASLTAPFDGIVVSENVEVGRKVVESDVALTLDRVDAVDAEFTLSDTQYGGLVGEGDALVGREIDVIWQIGDVRRTYRATINRVGAEISAVRGGIQVYARIAPSAETALPRPGAFVEIRLPGRTFPSSVRLASEVVYGGDTVFVVRNGRLEPREVTILARDGAEVIVDGGLVAGERVLATRIPGAGEGLLVEETIRTPAPDASSSRTASESVRR